MSDPPNDPQVALLYSVRRTLAGSSYSLDIGQDLRGTLVLVGKGSTAAAKAVLADLDRAVEKAGDRDDKARAALDVSQMRGASLRGQAIVGRWLLKNRNNFKGIAIYGGGRTAAKIGRAVMTLAGIDQVEFFRDRATALAWLG